MYTGRSVDSVGKEGQAMTHEEFLRAIELTDLKKDEEKEDSEG